MFLDVPKHVEFRVDGFPLMREGDVVDMDLDLKEPPVRDVTSGKPPRKPFEVRGPYVVKRRLLRYSNRVASKTGFTQYLEMEPEGRVPS